MNLKDIKSFVFSGGEVHINIEDIKMDGYIYASITNSEDLIKLLMVTDAYKRKFNITPELYLPYIPYARQDRVCNNGEALSIKVFANLINSQNYPAVHVLDPHSDISTALINNVKVTDNTALVKKVWDNDLKSYHKDDLYLVSPDAGALKKTHKVAKAIGYDREVIFCEKQRDTKTGEITGTKIYCDNIEDNNFILVDDICDGGRTFIEIAKVLKEKGANRIILVVSHGIFSKGLDCIFEYIDDIYTTTSFDNRKEHEEDFDEMWNASNYAKKYSALELMQSYNEKELEKYIRKAV